jgi:hypothetical protein
MQEELLKLMLENENIAKRLRNWLNRARNTLLKRTPKLGFKKPDLHLKVPDSGKNSPRKRKHSRMGLLNELDNSMFDSKRSNKNGKVSEVSSFKNRDHESLCNYTSPPQLLRELEPRELASRLPQHPPYKIRKKTPNETPSNAGGSKKTNNSKLNYNIGTKPSLDDLRNDELPQISTFKIPSNKETNKSKVFKEDLYSKKSRQNISKPKLKSILKSKSTPFNNNKA